MITEGADRRVLAYCHAGCSLEAVVQALGKEVRDLFPPGHRSTRPYRPTVEKQPSPAQALLIALHTAGYDWNGLVSSECPYCSHPAAWWRITPSAVEIDCPDGCLRSEILQALDHRVAIAEAAG